MAIRLIVYEDNDLLRDSLVSLIALDNRFELIAAYSNATEIENKLKNFSPNVILMDIDMPGITGIEAVKKIRQQDATVPIIMLTVFEDNSHVFDALRAGASGYLLKKYISTKLFEAIEEVLSGGAPMSPSIARLVVNSMQNMAPANNYALTARENEILAELSNGQSYKMIAASLAISLDTVRTHIKNIYEKLQVHSQTEAVSKAINERLI